MALCFAGAYSEDINRQTGDATHQYILSPPDMDEATSAVLNLVNLDTAFGARGTTGLQRVQQFVAGYGGGLTGLPLIGGAKVGSTRVPVQRRFQECPTSIQPSLRCRRASSPTRPSSGRASSAPSTPTSGSSASAPAIHALRDARLDSSADGEDVGLAVRVVHDGAWGFASGIDRTADAARAAGRAGGARRRR